jgi:hypothetical protein
MVSILFLVTFLSGALAGYFYRDHISRLRHRRVLAQRYSGN